ncbi:MAG: DUF120 domain-containing protein [Candidatus Aenigmarchaeota archaeon]|nr:DUF120 domain-containing protein [Candidatus Aenigmarchaeota archaeon]
MLLKGTVFTGPHRGGPLIEKFKQRIAGLICYEPYPGTMGIKLSNPIDFEDFATKRVEHILIDGSKKTDLLIAPAKLKYKENTTDCWACVQPKGIYHEDVVELLAKENLKNTLEINDGDEIELELVKRELPKRKSSIFRNIF